MQSDNEDFDSPDTPDTEEERSSPPRREMNPPRQSANNLIFGLMKTLGRVPASTPSSSPAAPSNSTDSPTFQELIDRVIKNTESPQSSPSSDAPSTASAPSGNSSAPSSRSEGPSIRELVDMIMPMIPMVVSATSAAVTSESTAPRPPLFRSAVAASDYVFKEDSASIRTGNCVKLVLSPNDLKCIRHVFSIVNEESSADKFVRILNQRGDSIRHDVTARQFYGLLELLFPEIKSTKYLKISKLLALALAYP